MKEEEEEEEEDEEENGSSNGSGQGSSSLSYHSTTSPSIAPQSMSSSLDEPIDELFDSPMDEYEVVRRCSLGDSPHPFLVRSGRGGKRNKQPYCASLTAMLNGSSVVANQSTSNRRRIKVGIIRLTGTQPNDNNKTIFLFLNSLLHLIPNQSRRTSPDLTWS